MTGFTPGSGTPIDIDITSANSSLQGIADAINAKKAGVTASILTDADGSRLVLKGATGAAQAFTLNATEDSGTPGLAALNIGVGADGHHDQLTAQDAIVAVDGVAVKRPTNSIDDLIPGVKLDLVSAVPGTKVSLGTVAPTDSLNQAVGDFVDAYNQLYSMLQTATDAVTGPLKTDSAAKALMRSMSQLTVKDMTPGAATTEPHTLAALGVATNRDGSLKSIRPSSPRRLPSIRPRSKRCSRTAPACRRRWPRSRPRRRATPMAWAPARIATRRRRPRLPSTFRTRSPLRTIRARG
jgi:flagellar hook-associated protein 2